MIAATNNEFVQVKRFKSYAVLDLETNDLLTAGLNKVVPIEFSLFGFAAEELEKSWGERNDIDSNKIIRPTTPYNATINEILKNSPWPAKPRVLHKLTLMLNPRFAINQIAEKVTGLNNYDLEFEKHFDENAANTILGFLNHLQQPVCLVAHNGFQFDYRIIKNCFQKLNMTLPDDTFCIDSLRAFQKIDETRLMIALANDVSASNKAVPNGSVKTSVPSPPSTATETTTTTTTKTIITADRDEIINWQKRNETTPKRPIIFNEQVANLTRKNIAESFVQVNINVITPLKNVKITKTATTAEAAVAAVAAEAAEAAISSNKRCSDYEQEAYEETKKKTRRCLFPEESEVHSQKPNIKKYPPKGMYKLSNIFERIFQQKPATIHHAEADVDMLMRLMLHYGVDFLEYTEKYAIPFADIK